MKFTVYQIDISENDLKNPVILNQYRDIKFAPNAELISKMKRFYTEVAEIKASNFSQVFEIGNIGPEEYIIRKAPMYSVSVGDVIIDEQGTSMFVDKIGFGEVCFKS
jgi:hypothetical protein